MVLCVVKNLENRMKHMNHCKQLIVHKYSTPAKYLNIFLGLLLELGSYVLYFMFIIFYVLNFFPLPALQFYLLGIIFTKYSVLRFLKGNNENPKCSYPLSNQVKHCHHLRGTLPGPRTLSLPQHNVY